MIVFAGRGILLDIEGTTSSISMVYDLLFPYARRHLTAFLKQHWREAETQHAAEMIAREAGASSLTAWCGEGADEATLRSKVAGEALRLMDADVKATGLKELQGLIWREGYAAGELKSHVYTDVPKELRKWQALGYDLRIFSSGSITAQKMFFEHTDAGNLLGCFRGHYDTTTGPKRDAKSYQLIAGLMQMAAAEVLFLSDIVAELDAARAAGMATGLVVRPGNAAIPADPGHPVVHSFAEITLTRDLEKNRTV